MMAQNVTRIVVGKHGASVGRKIARARLNKSGWVSFTNLLPPVQVDPVDRECAAHTLHTLFGVSHQYWYERLWQPQVEWTVFPDQPEKIDRW